jgi:putative flippase GtrA
MGKGQEKGKMPRTEKKPSCGKISSAERVEDSDGTGIGDGKNIADGKKYKDKSGGLGGEIIRYLVFGVLTTFVSLGSNFGVLWGGKALFSIEDTRSAGYIAVFSAAKVISWICAVLFAFFTNKKWVFRDHVKGSSGIMRQLLVFSGGRLATLGLDYVLNMAFLWTMTALSISFLDGLFGLSLDRINELAAWLATQFFVVASNYFLSKWFVFNRKR